MNVFRYLRYVDYERVRAAIGNVLDGQGGILNRMGILKRGGTVPKLISEEDLMRHWIRLSSNIKNSDILEAASGLYHRKDAAAKAAQKAADFKKDHAEEYKRLLDMVESADKQLEKPIDLLDRVIKWQEGREES